MTWGRRRRGTARSRHSANAQVKRQAEAWLRGRPPSAESSRDRMLGELDLPEHVAWQLYGLIDDTPVLRIPGSQEAGSSCSTSARFAQIHMPPESSGAWGDAVVELAEPDEADTRAGLVRPTVDEGADTPIQAGTNTERAEDRLREEMMKVKIKFWLPGRLHVCGAAAARTLTWEP